jgi:hypothetical protein
MDPAEQLALIESLKACAGYKEWYLPTLQSRLNIAKEAVLDPKIGPEEREKRHSFYMAVLEISQLVGLQEGAIKRTIK